MGHVIVLFEDQEEYRQDLLTAIARELGQTGTAKLFEPKAQANSTELHEERLERDLTAEYQEATLLVADRDLSRIKFYGGLSEATVRRVAEKLGIPVCAYARGDKGPEFLWAAEHREACIALAIDDQDRFARQVSSVAEGFAQIARELPTAVEMPGRKSPGRLMATVLGKPEYADKIELYASGDQERLVGVRRVRGDQGQRLRQLTCLLGYWLWDSILRFPGVVVNSVAAASYLNIQENEFHKMDVQGLFAAARYQGPFACAIEGPIWWRGMLDDIVADSGCADGREFAMSRLKRDVPTSQCCEDPSQPAGYYCMLSKKPVSLENSVEGLRWFPRGADLARVSRREHEELSPWL